jgi:hypothetical protein
VPPETAGGTSTAANAERDPGQMGVVRWARRRLRRRGRDKPSSVKQWVPAREGKRFPPNTIFFWFFWFGFLRQHHHNLPAAHNTAASFSSL